MPLEQLKLFPTQHPHLHHHQPQRFEYSLPSANTVLSVPIEYSNEHHQTVVDNVTTSISSAAAVASHSPVTYLDRGQWYEVKVAPLYPQLNYSNATSEREQIYFSLKIEFVDKQMEEIDMILWRRWLDLHPGERLLEIDPSADCGIEKILYDSHEHNHVGLVVVQNCAEEMRFRVRFNCVSSQFPLLLTTPDDKCRQQVSSSDSFNPPPQLPVFRLVVESYSDVTGVKFDSVACMIKLFWPGMSAHQHQMDRYRLIRSGSAESLQHLSAYYQCAQTLLTRFSRQCPLPLCSNQQLQKSATTEKLYPNIMKMLQQPLERPKQLLSSSLYPKIPAPPEGEDQRKVLCILRAASNSGPAVHLTRGRHYQMNLRPLNLDRNRRYTTCVRLSLGKSRQEEAVLMTNLTAMLGQPLMELNYANSDLNEAVLDVQCASRHNMSLIWSAAQLGEVKFTFRLNCLSADFCTCASQDNVDLYLLVETFAHGDSTSGTPIEQSYCQIKIEKSTEPKNIGFNDLLKSVPPQPTEFTVLKCGSPLPKPTEDTCSINSKLTIFIFYLYLNDKNYTTMPFPLSFSPSSLTLERLRDKLFLPLVQKYVNNPTIRLEHVYYRELKNAFCKEASISIRDDKCAQRVFKPKCGYKLELEPIKPTTTSTCKLKTPFNFVNFPSTSTSKAPNYKFHCPAPASTPASPSAPPLIPNEETSYNLYISECFHLP